jgi:predicted MFS family arabinose efflux permease
MGPIFGGLLGSVDFGEGGLAAWRLIFFVIAGCAGLLWVISLFGIKETLDKVPGQKLHCINPFSPLQYLKYFRITLLISCISIGFAGFFAINISFPIILNDIYQQPSITVGLCYLPFGVGLVMGAVIGGRSSDRIRKKGGTPEHRLLPSLLFIPLNGLFIIGQGWVFEFASNIHLSVVLLMSFFLGLTFILPRPGTNTYVIEKLKMLEGRDVASAATGLVFGVMLPFSAIIAQLATLGFIAIGYGLFLTIVGSAMVLATLPIAIFVIRDVRQAKRDSALIKGKSNPRPHVDYDAIN